MNGLKEPESAEKKSLSGNKQVMKLKPICTILILLTAILALSAADRVHAVGVIGTVTVGDQPESLVYDSGKGEIFVQNHGADTISVISDRNNSVVATIPVGEYPAGMAYDSSKGEIFESDLGGVEGPPTVQVISDTNNSVVATISGAIWNMAYDSAKGEVFVSHYDTNDVWVISDSTNTVVASIPVGFEPTDLVYDSGRGEIWVNNGSYSVSVISDNTNAVIAIVNIPNGSAFASTMAYDPSKAEIFVTLFSEVAVVSDSTYDEIATIPSDAPYGLAYDSAKGEIFVADAGSNTTSIVSDNNNTVIASVHVEFPCGVAYDSGKGEIFVANGYSRFYPVPFSTDTVTVISDSQNLTPPSVFASADSVSRGQTSNLTSNVTTGASPYSYQWFAKAPRGSIYALIENATSPNYDFATSTSTATGDWSFILQVTDAVGTNVNSTAIAITVNSPIHSVSLPNFGLIAIAAVIVVCLCMVAFLLKKFKRRS